MKNIILLSACVIFILQACKHENISPDVSTPSIALVASPGSYWVYDWYKIDSSGNETYFDNDSVYVQGDTTILNHTYIIYKGTDLSSPKTEFLRDSLGYLVTSTGRILWNKNDIGTIEYVKFSDFNISYAITNLAANVSTTVGDFTGIQKSRTACYLDKTPFTPCDHCYTDFTYYVEGLGVVLEQTAYLGEVNRNCTYLEKRLVRYQIN
jgi:hypothetical protein